MGNARDFYINRTFCYYQICSAQSVAKHERQTQTCDLMGAKVYILMGKYFEEDIFFGQTL
jgi:hypothetical protein